MPSATSIEKYAHLGIFASRSTHTTSSDRREQVEHAMREHEPTRRAAVPLRPGIRRRSTATRASSPTRPGNTALANRPTQNAEKTSGNDGCGGGIDSLTAVFQESDRAITESRLSAIATTTHSQLTTMNASCTRCQSGPRRITSPTATPRSGSTMNTYQRESPTAHAATSSYVSANCCAMSSHA